MNIGHFTTLSFVSLLCACGGAEPAYTRSDMASLKMSETPRPRVFKYVDAELRVVSVPVAAKAGILEQKHCFIWRDMEFKTTSISCTVPGLPGIPSD